VTLIRAGGDIVAAGLGVWLVWRLAGGLKMLERPRHVFVFALIALCASAPIDATATLMADTLAGRADAVTGSHWLDVWASAAALFVTAGLTSVALIRWWMRRRDVPSRRRRGAGARALVETGALETAALALSTLLVAAWIVMAPAHPDWPANTMWPFLTFPLVCWAAFRLGALESGIAVACINAAVWWTARSGHTLVAGPHAWRFTAASLVVTSLTAFAVAASVEYRSQHQTRLRQLAVTDPLTGLANLRHLVDAIDRNIARSLQTRSPFAVMLLDVDYLKAINDRHGHAAGNRLLVRLAAHLRESFRSTDLLARQGGDEFAVVLPGCDASGADIQAERIRSRLGADPEPPRLSVSIGTSVFPRDGDAADALLEHADRDLYAAKARRPRRAVPNGTSSTAAIL
jgi:diguanylate cyclase (GGDEF)-like protein